MNDGVQPELARCRPEARGCFWPSPGGHERQLPGHEGRGTGARSSHSFRQPGTSAMGRGALVSSQDQAAAMRLTGDVRVLADCLRPHRRRSQCLAELSRPANSCRLRPSASWRHGQQHRWPVVSVDYVGLALPPWAFSIKPGVLQGVSVRSRSTQTVPTRLRLCLACEAPRDHVAPPRRCSNCAGPNGLRTSDDEPRALGVAAAGARPRLPRRQPP